MIKNKIFFRVDSGTKIGYGHLIRCLSLAENLKKYYKVIFTYFPHIPLWAVHGRDLPCM